MGAVEPPACPSVLPWIFGLALVGCSGGGGDGSSSSGTAGTAGTGASGSVSAGTGGGTSASGTGTATAGGTATDGTATAGDTGGDPPPADNCDRPIELADVSQPDAVVGDGTPESCTHGALAAAAQAGGVIVFDCGPDPVTIAIEGQIDLPLDRDTVIDGGERVILDAGGGSRIFSFDSPDFRATTTTVTVQRITLRGGKAPASDFTPDPGDGCAWGYKDGAGGAIYVRDGVLHVIDAVFENNAAASPGPDVGGGAIYAVGSLDVTVVGSVFTGNEGSNSGAIGLLQSTGTFVGDLFADNRATGDGANYVKPGCPEFNHPEQGGAGGNGGAMAVDGVEPTELYFCGCEFRGNQAGELGGAVFRTPNGDSQKTTFIDSLIDGNVAQDGGGGLYISNSDFTLERCTVMNNSTDGLGGGVRTELGTVLNLVNSTIWGNESTTSLAGGLSYDDAGGGTIRNCTFANNRAEGGEGIFAAAIRGTTAQIFNTIIVDNTTLDIYNPMQCWFDPHSGANNVQWPLKRGDSDIDDTPCVMGIVFDDPQLGPLGDNGGPTPTAIPAGAAALGAGADCPEVDQRGEPRPPQGCTLGAVEAP